MKRSYPSEDMDEESDLEHNQGKDDDLSVKKCSKCGKFNKQREF